MKMTIASADLFAPLPTIVGGWACVHADPPWRFRSNSVAKPGRNVMRHYDCLSLGHIAALPVKDVVARDAFAFLWVPGPFLVIGAHISILHAWGFEPTATGFVWVKLRSRAAGLFIHLDDVFIGTGFTTRKSCEFVVIGRRGKPQRLAANVREVIFAPVREPSRKPDQFYDRVEAFCPGPRLDLFGRQSREGWQVYGQESTLFDEASS